MYNNLLIYYFSGTGNALSVANWVKENAEKENIKVQSHSIEKIDKVEIPDLEGKTLIGLFYPTHGFIAPWLVLKFILKFPKIKNADAFFVNTRGGSKIWKLHLPGLSGLAQWFSIFAFWIKGYSVKGSLPIDLPQNWIAICPPLNKAAINSMFAHCRKSVDKMTKSMFSGKTFYGYNVWLGLPLDIAIIPVTIGYVFIGRFFIAKSLYSSYTCNGCELCATNCPVQAIEMRNDRPYWKYTCESCMRCMNICPKRSIQSWATRIALLFYVFSALGIYVATDFLTLYDNIYFFILFPVYWILFKLLRIKFVNAIFTFTSFTRLWGRYLAIGVKAKDFKKENFS